MRHHFFPAAVLLAGVLAAHLLFSVLVYFSNVSLYQNLITIKNSGYVIVPNEFVLPTLQSIKPALCGGLFFALTTGAGLTLITFLIVSGWRRYSNQYWLLSSLFLVATVFFTIKFSYNIPVTLVCISTVGAVIFAVLKFFPDSDGAGYPIFRMFSGHLVVIVLIILIWMPRISSDVFVSIRDNLLLSNPIGEKINNFYYKYTLYPAETFKSLDQKLLKSCRIKVVNNKNLYQQIEQRMIAQDYLAVDEKFDADLIIDYDNNTLVFRHQGKAIHHCSSDKFLSGSKKILELISEKIDHNKFLRKITFLSLISASPLICYIFLHALFMAGLFFVESNTLRFAGASTVCLLMFTLPAISFYHQPAGSLDDTKLGKYLKSDIWQDRVAALKAISDQNLRIERYIEPDQLDRLIQGPLIAERYWLAKTLGSSRSPESYQLILRLLDDPQPNVVCMAMYSLGKQNHFKAPDEIATTEIIRRIKSSEHWYVQWYAYKALKRLGWTQEK
ncbi:MAG: HEAT repeat domain-containing protein [Desulfobacteraceae bacterium]|nr:HEAT repeat domain-containing protein [Desulfobacteraceae bacterium]MBC2755776.1 HEAT repeat domain-containing protein [Desulfobacteraceae bacterium]